MAATLTGVDASRLARPFRYFLGGMAALAGIAAWAILAEVVPPALLIGALSAVAVALVAGLATWLYLVAGRHGRSVDPTAALLAVDVQDLADWGIAGAAFSTAGVVVGARGWYGLSDPFLLLAGVSVAVGVVAVVRLFRVRLLVYPDAVVRAPRSGLANRYTWDELTSVTARGPLLRLRTATPFADWTCVTRDAEHLAARIRAHRTGEEE